MVAAAKSLQLCPTLCDPIDGSPPGSPVPGILQARTLEWVAISSSNAWKWKVKVKSLSRVWLLATPRTAAHQAPPSMGFSRQEDWSGAPLPSLLYCAVLFILYWRKVLYIVKRMSHSHCHFYAENYLANKWRYTISTPILPHTHPLPTHLPHTLGKNAGCCVKIQR